VRGLGLGAGSGVVVGGMRLGEVVACFHCSWVVSFPR